MKGAGVGSAPAAAASGPQPAPERGPAGAFAAQHRGFALLAHAIAGRPLRLEPHGLPIDAARLPPPGRDAGTAHVPIDTARAANADDAQRMLRLGVLREALRATDRPPDDPPWMRRERAVLERRVFALLERARVDAVLRRRFPGAVPEVDRAAALALARVGAVRPGPGVRALIDALTREVLGAPRAPGPDPGGTRARVLDEVGPLRSEGADAAAAHAAARRVVARLVAATGRRPGDGDRIALDGLEPVSGAAASAGPGGDGSRGGRDGATEPAADGERASAPGDGERAREGAPGGGRGADPVGAVVVDPPSDRAPRDASGRPRPPRAPAPRRPPPGGTLVDEWDSVGGVMLRAWCRVVEIRLRGTETRFLDDVRRRHPALWDELHRRLARMRPTGRRRVRGVGDGDELDLDGVIASVVDRRAGRASDERAYTRRDPVVRDVAAGFLADLSASTAVAVPGPDDGAPDRADAAPRADTGALLYGVYDDPDPAGAAPPAPRRRVVDVEKDALALMAATLESLGDACALWGFSGDGRDRVEFMVAKSFDDPLSGSVWAALAAMQPRGSTRMGAAIRHATAKLRREPASRRLLVVVSDGYPQDSDYGPDRLDVEYGLRDTARALADAEREGVATCCVTVDPAGHDYLRRMCPPRRYRVIEDVPQLPAALAEVYAELAGRAPAPWRT